MSARGTHEIPTLEPTTAGKEMHAKHSLLGAEGKRSIQFKGTMYTYSESQSLFGAILPPYCPPPGLALPFPSPGLVFVENPPPPLSHTHCMLGFVGGTLAASQCQWQLAVDVPPAIAGGTSRTTRVSPVHTGGGVV